MESGLKSIRARFAQVARRCANRVSIHAHDTQWTYAHLDQFSHALAAHTLERLGEKPEPVAFLMEPDALLIGGILGALKAGKMYLALDPGQPRERLVAMLADSRARLLFTDKSSLMLANSLASDQLRISEVTEDLAGNSRGTNLPEVSPEAGAWLMYTSGSTGAPKGVWQNHCSVVHHTDVYAELIQLASEDRFSLLTSCSLAASATPLFTALLHGATLCPLNLRLQGVTRLADWLHQTRISVYHSVPTVFRQLFRFAQGHHIFQTVRLIRLGGEMVLRGDVELYRRYCPDTCRFMQAFSSTETGLITAMVLDKKTELPSGRLPVGHAVRGVEVLVVNSRHQPVPSGNEGRIAVRSAHLSQGYWQRPDMTANAFRADSANAQRRMFVSGDLGRILPDGSLEHLGRADQVVKILGQRVGLGEVEAALLATDLASEAAAIAPEPASGEQRLVAYIVPRPGADVSPQNFRRELRAQLPEHMVPGEFVALERLPRSPGGKIDRRALVPPPRHDRITGLTREQRPRDIIDTRLARIWESVLGFSPVGRRDDFFTLGGTSLQSVEVLLRIEEMFGVSLPPSTLAERSTIEQLAPLLADHVVIRSPSPLVLLKPGGDRKPLFLIHSGQGDVTSYSLLARRLAGRPIYGLQSVGLQGERWPLMSVPAMAQRYLGEILGKIPNGPYLLAGTCMGGLVALELAQLLIRQRKEVGLLALIDTQPPLTAPEHARWKERYYKPVRMRVHDAYQMLIWASIRAVGLCRSRRWLRAYRRFVVSMNGRASRCYKPAFYPGTITLLVSDERNSLLPAGDSRLWISHWTRETRTIVIPGKRAGLFARPMVDELARQLQTCLELAEAPAIPQG